MLRQLLKIALVFSLLALAACGSNQTAVPEMAVPDGGLSLRVTDAAGNELPAGAGKLMVFGNSFEIYADSPLAAGFMIAFDADQQHIVAVERGDYFGPGDLFLAVSDIAGQVAIGGYHTGDTSDSGANSNRLVARVNLASGAGGRVVSALPTGGNAQPQNLSYVDLGGGQIRLDWDYRNVGDYSQDGEVNISDITPVGVHFGLTGADAGWAAAAVADGDGNNEVNIADLTPIGLYYQCLVSGYKVERSTTQAGEYIEVLDVPLASGSADPQLAFSTTIDDARNNEWYRVRAYAQPDPEQGADSDPVMITLAAAGESPTAVASSDLTTGLAPVTILFYATGSNDPDGSIVSYTWDFDGDGAIDRNATATQGDTGFTYMQGGEYDVTLTVTDNDGNTDTDTIQISLGQEVVGEPPFPAVYATPAQGWAPLTVQFSAFESSDPDGTITGYNWDFDGDGVYETAGAGEWGYAEYTFSAGDHAVKLEVTDSDDNTSVADIMIAARDPADSSVDYWTVFDDSSIRRVEFYVSQANWDAMWVDVRAELEVEADAVIFPGTALEADLTSVGLRMKGNSTLKYPGDKKPWKIDTNEYDDLQEFENLKMLIFNNGVKDPSLTRETIGYDMMYAAGVPASNTCYVEIWISIAGAPLEFFGVYTMVERIDKKFLENRFGDDNGNLYKCKMGSSLEYLGLDINSYPRQDGAPCYSKETNEELADYSDIINLMQVINDNYASEDEFCSALESVFNVDGFLRYMAVTFGNCNLDVYMYMNQNYYLYNNPVTGKFEWLPWDLNMGWGAFGSSDANAGHPLYELVDNVGGPGGNREAPLAQKVLAVERYRRDLAAYYDLLRRSFFTAANVSAQAQGWHDLISDSVHKDGVNGDRLFYGEKRIYQPQDFDINWLSDTQGPPQSRAFGVTSFTETRCSYIDANLPSWR